MDKLGVLVERLRRIGIQIELMSNYPWIYLNSVNGQTVTEKSHSNHGYTIAFIPIRKDVELNFIDIGDMFKIIRNYAKGN